MTALSLCCSLGDAHEQCHWLAGHDTNKLQLAQWHSVGGHMGHSAQQCLAEQPAESWRQCMVCTAPLLGAEPPLCFPSVQVTARAGSPTTRGPGSAAVLVPPRIHVASPLKRSTQPQKKKKKKIEILAPARLKIGAISSLGRGNASLPMENLMMAGAVGPPWPHS